MMETANSLALTRAHFAAELCDRGFRRAKAKDLKRYNQSMAEHLGGADLFRDETGEKRKLVRDVVRFRRKRVDKTLANSRDYWVGPIVTVSGTHDVLVQLGPAFPFMQPAVSPRLDFPQSWHRNIDGTMCLYPEGERGGLPWLDPDAFLELIARWLTEADAGWPGDFPLLDIEAYVPRSTTETRLVTYGDLDGLDRVEFRAEAFTLRLIGTGQRSEGPHLGVNALLSPRYGMVVDIGSPDVPPRDWDDLASLIGSGADRVMEAVLTDEISILLVRYSRGGVPAVLALEVQKSGDSEGLSIRSLHAASENSRDLMLRAGAHASEFREKRVLVVGAGAVGSFTADSLARAGVGHLSVMDFDLVKPGNLVRHLADDRHVGIPKVHAVREVIESRHFNVTRVAPIQGGLWLPDAALKAVRRYDLVVDATADGTVTALLHHAAQTEGKNVVSVCLKENGQLARVDVLPPIEGDPLPTPWQSPMSEVLVGYESGCYAAVSLTPHAAVMEAAALATRHALALLRGRPLHPAGVERDYR